MILSDLSLDSQGNAHIVDEGPKVIILDTLPNENFRRNALSVHNRRPTPMPPPPSSSNFPFAWWFPARWRRRRDPSVLSDRIAVRVSDDDEERGALWGFCSLVGRRWLTVWILLVLVFFIVAGVGIWAALRASRQNASVPHSSKDNSQLLLGPPHPYSELSKPLFNDTIPRGSHANISIPYDRDSKHILTITGAVTGNITINAASSLRPTPGLSPPSTSPGSAKDMMIDYDISLSGDKNYFDQVVLRHTDIKGTKYTLVPSWFNISTPSGADGVPPLSYSIAVSVPRGLKRLWIGVETAAQVNIMPDAYIGLEDVIITRVSAL